jgi:hypothetical protein
MSAEFGETKARIPLVPKIYKKAMGKAVRAIARGRTRAGLCVSPEKIAMYSRPARAPKVILLKTLRVNSESGGTVKCSGW